MLEYDGTPFSGWQVQPGQRTVQSELERALQSVFADPKLRVVASGRTDAGVHALGQVVSFRSSADRKAFQVRDGLNALLPKAIVCLKAEERDPAFHAQLSATGKLYRYVFRISPTRRALERDRAWELRQPLDTEAMQTALKVLEGRHDFSSFRARGCAAKSPVRVLHRADLLEKGDEIWIELYGEGFLRHMVRNIVGSLHDVGRRKQEPEWFSTLLQAKDRTQGGVTAPACGLFLVRVDYVHPPLSERGEEEA